MIIKLRRNNAHLINLFMISLCMHVWKIIVLCMVYILSVGVAETSNTDITIETFTSVDNPELAKYKELAYKFELLLKEYNDIDLELSQLTTDYIIIIKKEECLKKRRAHLTREIHEIERKMIKSGYSHLIPELVDQSKPYNEKLARVSEESKKPKESDIIDTEIDADPDIIPTVTLSGVFMDFGDFIQPVIEKIYNFFHQKPWSDIQAEARKRTIYNTSDTFSTEKQVVNKNQ